jgi:hypothetical protein
MRKLALLLLLTAMALPSFATNEPKTDKVTVAQLEQALAGARTRSDASLAQQLSGMELTERLSTARLAQLKAALPGQKAQEALLALADLSLFLAPPAAEVPADAAPDAAATRQMLTKVVNYVNTTARQLPNFLATRETTGFEDRPQEDEQQELGVVSHSYLPLHVVGKSTVSVTYRDRQEVVDEGKGNALKQGQAVGGLVVNGVFGPILSRVVADALTGKITWGRWEQGAQGTVAVFHYAVTQDKSNYRVRFCCLVQGYTSTGLPDLQPFDERAAYHGEIAFDPSTGAILRIAMEAEMPSNGLVSRAGMLIEYGPVEIAGKSFICPSKSVSLLTAHTGRHQGAFSRSNYQGPGKTYLNNVVFGQYRRFGSEMHILPGE